MIFFSLFRLAKQINEKKMNNKLAERSGNRLLVIAGASLSLYRLSVSRRYNSEDLPAITNDFLFHLLFGIFCFVLFAFSCQLANKQKPKTKAKKKVEEERELKEREKDNERSSCKVERLAMKRFPCLLFHRLEASTAGLLSLSVYFLIAH